MTKIKEIISNNLYLLAILIIGIIITIPQINAHSTVIGADGLFHFNRFYDAAMQIKNFNFSYFTQLYGFLNSGRIVTAIYSPLMTYFLGGLLLICNSFYRFEIVTRIAFFIIAGGSMRYALRIANVKNKLFVQISCVAYAFCPALIRWGVAQNFSSIGALFIPVIIACGIRMVNNRERPINWIQLGGLMALTIQAHLATTIQLTVILFVYFIVALITNKNNRIFLIKNVFYAIILCSVLSLNILAGMWELYHANYIVPIAKFSFANGTGIYNIFHLGSGKWINLFFIIMVVIILLVLFRKMTPGFQVTGILSIILFFCATNIFIDWHDLMLNSKLFSNLLQFPSRLVSPAITTALITIAGVGEFVKFSGRRFRLFGAAIAGILILFLGINMRSNLNYSKDVSQKVLVSDRSTIPYTKPTANLINDVNSTFSQPLNNKDMILLTKSTSDYMPATRETENAHYHDYNRKIIIPSKTNEFKKDVQRHQIIISWQSNKRYTTVPVAYYANTNFKLNGKNIHPENASGLIKIPKVKNRIGSNTLIVTYHPDLISKVLLTIAIIAWSLVVIFTLIKLIKKEL